MEYVRILRIPQYFRNLQRLGEIVTVLVKHGFGDLVDRLQLNTYVESSLRIIKPALRWERQANLDIATRLRLAFEELGPTFVKFGQLIASRPDVFPHSFVQEFRKLHDKVPSFPFEEAKKLIELELKAPISEVFSNFEETPLAAASIAQVHLAVLKSGERVVVKVQRPNIERVIETDVEILMGIAGLLEERIPESQGFAPVRLIEEFARGLKQECDFAREASNMRRFALLFSAEPSLVVPEVFREYSTRKVLTEQHLDGIKADNIAEIRKLGIPAELLVDALCRILLGSIFEHRFFHADPHPGNVFIMPDGKIGLIDFGSMGRIDEGRLFFILKFLVSVVTRDLDHMVRVLCEQDFAPQDVDEVAIKNQVSDILDAHFGQPLGSLDLARLLGEVFEVVRRHGIRPPPDLLLIGKSVTTLVAIAKEIDPGFDPMTRVKPYLVRQYKRFISDPSLYKRRLRELSASYQHLFSVLPKELKNLLAQLTRHTFTLHTSSKDRERVLRHQNSLINRTLMTVLGLALLGLGNTSLLLDAEGLHRGLATGFTITGIILIVFVFISIHRSGGMNSN